MKNTWSRFLLLALVMVTLVGCGRDKKSDPAPVPNYRATIVGMSLSADTATVTAAPKYSHLLASYWTGSAQNFYSGNIVNTTDRLIVEAAVRNDSDVPIRIMFMTWWAPEGYPYPEEFGVNRSIFHTCASPAAELASGQTVTVSWGNHGGSTMFSDPSLLGDHAVSIYIYPITDMEFPLDCYPDRWDGTLPGLMDYVANNEPIAVGTNHFTVVAP